MKRAIQMTPAGSGAIAVVRLTGDGVPEFLNAHFSRQARIGRCVHGDIVDAGRVLDDAVVVLGDGWADLNLHGGSWVVKSVLELARVAGFEIGERVEMPLPVEAVEGETEIERQVMAAVPLAATEWGLRVLLGQIKAWKEAKGYTAAERAEMVADEELWWLLHPPRVAIAGAANVGKSTLANQLFAQERSITADLPGTTRDWVGEMANIDGLAVTLVDTPGIRQTTDPIEQAAIERAGGVLAKADLVVLVLDASRSLDDQKALMQRFEGAVRVINKVDLPKAWQGEGIHICAKSGGGVDELRAVIKERFGFGKRAGKAKWWTREQREHLR